MYLIRWQETIQLNPLPDDDWHKFFNILDLAAINAWVIYKEIVGTKIKNRNHILNLDDQLQKNCVPSKTSTLSTFTPSTDDGPTASSRKRKQRQINRHCNKTMKHLLRFQKGLWLLYK
ncbi:hypothetical protein AVEN_42998-1 [Araneus ventricosus]|uniref:PiggyBac transposable element-derived protein domain-containing protein n=1 Tax=Araneus ventricosus TaxID=182803 RepID=A0A4Y2IET3_ARAVE|nr:hypothetical protein AVEN_42998-1 [Araneus ventricosus]